MCDKSELVCPECGSHNIDVRDIEDGIGDLIGCNRCFECWRPSPEIAQKIKDGEYGSPQNEEQAREIRYLQFLEAGYGDE